MLYTIAATVANHSMNPPKEWRMPTDYMPGHAAKPKRQKRDPQQIANQIREALRPYVAKTT